MKKVAVLAVVLLALTVGMAVPTLAGQTATLRPGSPSSDVRYLKKPPPMEKRTAHRSRFARTPPGGIVDTLRAYTGIGGINFGFDSGDSMIIWFDPPAACSLLAIRAYVLNWEGNMLLDVWDGSPYDGHITTQDSTDANGWIGTYVPIIDTNWFPGPVMGHTPLGWNATDTAHHYWGPFPFSVTQTHANQWVEIPASYGLQGEVDLGSDPFYVSAVFFKTGGWGFLCDEPDYVPYSFFKFYRQCCGPDEAHDGWFIRSYSPWVEVVVSYYENTPPKISGMTVQNDTYGPGPFKITADIRDQDAENPAKAGIASAFLVYTIHAETDSTAMDGPFEGGTFTGTVPSLAVWDTVVYSITACDPPGLCSRSNEVTFARIEPLYEAADLLLINDGMQVDSLYRSMLDNEIFDRDHRPYEYEYWDVSAHNGIDASVVNWGWRTIVVAGWGCRHTLPGKECAPEDPFASFLEGYATSSPDTHNILYIDQDYFCVHDDDYGCDWDQELGKGEFLFDYFGVALAISDNHGAEEGDYDSVAVGVEGDPISDEFADHPINFRPDALTDSPQNWNWPDWIDSETSGAARIFTYRDSEFGAGVRYDGGHFRTVFIPWQLDFAVDTTAAGDVVSRAGVARFVQNVLRWFGTKNRRLAVSQSERNSHTAEGYALYQNYPNPFNVVTTISFTIPGGEGFTTHHSPLTTLKIFNLLGQEVRTLVNGPQECGSYSATWDGRDNKGDGVSSGVYFYQLTVENMSRGPEADVVITRRMIVLR